MVVTKEEIELKGYEHQFTLLRADIKKETDELTRVLRKRESLQKEMDDFEADKKAFAEEKRLYKEIHEKEVLDNNKEIAEILENKINLSDSLALVKKDLKESRRLLAKTNAQCLSGQKEIERCNADIAALHEEIAKLTALVVHVEETKKELSDLSDDLVIVRSVFENLIVDSEFLIKDKEEKLKKLEEETVALEARRDKAGYELKSYTDQLYTAMNDYQVIKARLEEKWNMSFPELELPLKL